VLATVALNAVESLFEFLEQIHEYLVKTLSLGFDSVFEDSLRHGGGNLPLEDALLGMMQNHLINTVENEVFKTLEGGFKVLNCLRSLLRLLLGGDQH